MTKEQKLEEIKPIDISKIRGEWQEYTVTSDGVSHVSGGNDTIESIKMVAEKVNEILHSLLVTKE